MTGMIIKKGKGGKATRDGRGINEMWGDIEQLYPYTILFLLC